MTTADEPRPRPLETVSVAEAATNMLRERLFAGVYTEGQEIKDTQVSQEYGIARPTARVALQQLINEGILVREPGASARVRTFTPEQVRDIYRVRRMIEVDAIREIRERQLDLTPVEEALEGFSGLRDESDWTKIAAADVEFHSAVVNSASSARLQGYFAAITSEIRLFIALLRNQYQGGASLLSEHEELYLLLRDAPSLGALERAWVAHLDSAQEFLTTHLAERSP